MAAPLDVDREQVRMLVLAVGVRAAARQLGLKEDTVAQWSSRGKWLAHITNPPPLAPLPASMQPVSSVSKSPADALENVLASDNRETRLCLSKAARTKATRLAAEDDPDADQMHTTAKTAALVHGWAGQAGAGVRLTIFAGQAAEIEQGPVIDV